MTEHRGPLAPCVCGAQADPVYVDDLGNIVYVCRDDCGFDSKVPPVPSAAQAAQQWAEAVDQAQQMRRGHTQAKRAQVRQVLQQAEAAGDPLALWADVAAQALPELAKKKLVQSAAVAQAIALVRISQALTAEEGDGSESGPGAPGQVRGPGDPGVA